MMQLKAINALRPKGQEGINVRLKNNISWKSQVILEKSRNLSDNRKDENTKMQKGICDMKKFSALILTILVLFSFSACSKKGADPAATSTDLTEAQLEQLIEDLKKESDK